MNNQQGGQSIFEFQAYGLENTISSMEEYGKRLVAQGKITAQQFDEVNQINKQYKLQAERLTRLSKAYSNVNDYKQLEKITEQFNKQYDVATELEDKLKNMYANINVPPPVPEDEFDMDYGGGYGMGIGGLGTSATSAISGMGGMNDNVVSNILEGANSVAQFAQEAESLKREFQDAIPQIVDFVSGIRSGAKSMDFSLSGVAGALGSTGGIATLASASLLVWGKGLEILQNRIAQVTKATEGYIELIRAEGDRRQEIERMINAGDFEGLQSSFDNMRDSFESANYQLDQYNRDIEANDALYAELGASLNAERRSEIAERGRLLREERNLVHDGLDDIILAMNDYGDALASAKERQQQLQAIERVQEAEMELVQVRLDAQSVYKDYLKQIAEEEEQHQFDMGRLQEDRQIEDRDAMQSYLDERADMESTYRQEGVSATKEYYESVKTAQISAQNELAEMADSLAKELSDMATQLGEDIADAETEYQTQVQETNVAYFESSRETLEQHLKDMGNAQDAYNKERRRRLEDLNDELLQAEQSNDVISFLSAQKQAEKDLKRMQEDFGEQQSESQKQFDEERKLARIEHEKTLAQMKTDSAERIAELRTSFAEQRTERLQQHREQVAERKKALGEELHELRTSYTDRLAEMRDAHTTELQELEKRHLEERKEREKQREFDDRRAREDRQRQLDQMDKAHNEQIQAMETQETELLRVIQSGGYYQKQAVQSGQLDIVSAYRVGAQNAVSAIQGAMANVSIPSSGGTTYQQTQSNTASYIDRLRQWATGGRRNLPQTAFADGGVVTSPTIAMLGENLGGRFDAEAVIPFNRSEGLEMGLRRNGAGGRAIIVNVSPHFTTSVGDIATGGQVSQALMQYNDQITQTITTAIRQARLAQ